MNLPTKQKENYVLTEQTQVAKEEELGVLPEEEAAGGDEDREKEILIERIQSIKEEKQVSL